MSESREVQESRRRREAFDEMAPELGFELKETSFEIGEHTDLGLFFGAFASPVMSYDVVEDETPTNDDDKEIEECIVGWETLSPSDYCDNYTEFANDSYLLLGAEGIGHVGADDHEEDSEEFEEILENYPVHDPRKVKVKNVKVTHMGGMRASATYKVEEQFTNGTEFSGNATAVLAKLDQGWRIVIATDHLPES